MSEWGYIKKRIIKMPPGIFIILFYINSLLLILFIIPLDYCIIGKSSTSTKNLTNSTIHYIKLPSVTITFSHVSSSCQGFLGSPVRRFHSVLYISLSLIDGT